MQSEQFGRPLMTASRLVLEIPSWVDEVVAAFSEPLDSDRARMALTVRLSQENVARGGGPFAGTVFAEDRLLAAGVNLVLGSGFSIAHAEIVALMRAQAALGEASLSPPPLTLFASTEPCCQCFGALVWAGVRHLVCGAHTADAEAVGFDEGPKPAAWPQVLEQRGIAVTLGVLRADAQAVLLDYAARGGRIYGKFAD
jgi:tRNA(Arg) A34 adenosine deaminase TadA